MPTILTKLAIKNWAKEEKGVLFSKREYISALQAVYKNPPFMRANKAEFPYLYVPLEQSGTKRFCPDPFELAIQWYGIYGDKGYILVGNRMIVNGCTPKDLQDLLKRIEVDGNYYPYTNNFMTPATEEDLCTEQRHT